MAKKPEEQPAEPQLPPVTLVPMGAPDKQQDQANLLAAKQSPAFPIANGLLAHCLSRRGERVMLDYSAQGVAIRFEIDGVWMNGDPLDRQSGDAALAVYKKIANLNVQDRRSKQEGKFGVEFSGGKYVASFVSQGVKTGERVVITFKPKKPKFTRIEDLGMRDKMRQRLKEQLDADNGFIVVSAPPGGGLSTTWNLTLETADRLMRDFVSTEDKDNKEDEIINVGAKYYDRAAGQSPADLLPQMILKEPDVLVVPELTNAETVKILCEQINKFSKMAFTKVYAKEAAEALVKVFAYKGPVDELAKAVTAVVNVRLIRRLCDQCKQPFQPPPQLLQKLGIPAGRVQVLYQEYKPPPPEQLVDEKGNPIVPPICQKCGGIGYYGRTGLFELLVIDDQIRSALTPQPNLEAIKRVAKASGHRTIQEEGILQVAQGVTSINELQRVLKQ
ncbi:MAG: Flp pilus assembly complex ATPase component TadA [Planctomycetaceae bacterium]|nr:Flp pilus assembly complex ATPase component TadA [Planctomycetales bacterium]MCB9923911.1 Flp pilus assembly complex ATPase component TadA [Planctomycetaceae bacterium]